GGLDVSLAQLGDGDCRARRLLLALRVAAIGRRLDDRPSPIAGLVDREGAERADLDAPGRPADADLCDEHLFSRGIDPGAEAREAAAPQEILDLARLGSIERALCQSGHIRPLR